jgi:ribosome-binding protein aMBF1 (putative translation factor)
LIDIFYYTNIKKEFLLHFLMKCFKCGATSDQADLFDVISRTGVSKICEDCYNKEHFPVLKQNEPAKPEKSMSTYERLSGVKSRKGIGRKFTEQDRSLKSIVDDNYRKNLSNFKTRDDLVDNFHWVMMRVRRSKHLTQAQLAEAIGESELSIRMAEEGLLGEDSDDLIQKIEDALDVQLRKGPEFSRRKKKQIDPNSSLSDEMIIADLKEMEEEKVRAGKVPFWRSWIKKKDYSVGMEDEVESVEEADIEPYDESGEKPLTDEEVEDVLFGKK